MKNASAFLCILLSGVLLSFNTKAQDKPVTTLTSVTQKDDVVRFSLESSKPFIYGNNRYIMYIGGKEFYAHEQQYKKDGKGYVTFLIPIQDFNALKEGEHIYLSYGHINAQYVDMDARAKMPGCWLLGTFSKGLLK